MKKYVIAIIGAVFLLGFSIGISSEVDLSNVIAFTFNITSTLNILLICLLGFVLSFIGIPFYIMLMLWEVFSFGLITSLLFTSFSFKGIIFSIIFTLVIKVIYWFLLSLNSFYSLKLIKNNYKYLLHRFIQNKNNSKIYLKKIIVVSIGIIIWNLLSSLFGLKLTNFLLENLLLK